MSHIKLIKAQDKTVIERLIQLYLYDMAVSYYSDWPIGEDGMFVYEKLDDFWQYPYLVYKDDTLIGFTLVLDQCPITDLKPCWFIAELFILRQYRSQGYGADVYRQLLNIHKGLWHIGVIKKHIDAYRFWKSLLSVSGKVVHFDEEEWVLFQNSING